MANSYRIDLRVAMTAYIVADSEEQAIEKAVEHFGTERSPDGLELWEDYLPIGEPDSGVTLSPAVTFYGRCGEPELETEDVTE